MRNKLVLKDAGIIYDIVDEANLNSTKNSGKKTGLIPAFFTKISEVYLNFSHNYNIKNLPWKSQSTIFSSIFRYIFLFFEVLGLLILASIYFTLAAIVVILYIIFYERLFNKLFIKLKIKKHGSYDYNWKNHHPRLYWEE
jgi:hypothetical protein